LSQFLNAVGRENGEGIARNAILSEAYAKSSVDGIVNNGILFKNWRFRKFKNHRRYRI
jgi:hypothetical protein